MSGELLKHFVRNPRDLLALPVMAVTGQTVSPEMKNIEDILGHIRIYKHHGNDFPVRRQYLAMLQESFEQLRPRFEAKNIVPIIYGRFQFGDGYITKDTIAGKVFFVSDIKDDDSAMVINSIVQQNMLPDWPVNDPTLNYPYGYWGIDTLESEVRKNKSPEAQKTQAAVAMRILTGQALYPDQMHILNFYRDKVKKVLAENPQLRKNTAVFLEALLENRRKRLAKKRAKFQPPVDSR